MTKVNFVTAGQTTALSLLWSCSFRGCGTPGAEPSPEGVSGTLPAESTAAQTETPSSRRLFMYETVAYVYCSQSPFPLCSASMLRALCPRANLCVIHTSRLNDERRLFLPRAVKTSPESRKVHGRAFHHNGNPEERRTRLPNEGGEQLPSVLKF